MRRISIAFAFALSAVVGAGAGAGQVALAAQTPPPECRYDDVQTLYTSHKQWQMTLVDTIYALPKSSIPPPRLVSVQSAGLTGGEQVRRHVIKELAALAKAARKAGAPVKVVSGYRSYKQQKYLYEREVRNLGLEAGRLRVARPGHSEHHMGTAIDFGSPNDTKPTWKYDDWAESPTGKWLKNNAWRYGFLMSYPDGGQSITCYQYEPWHYRYVGRAMAADVAASGLTLREYLWREFH